MTAFQQARESEIENSKRWITADETGRIYYRFYEVYDARWKALFWKVFEPGRLRVIDGPEGRVPGRLPEQKMTEQTINADGMAGAKNTLMERWSVVSVTELKAMYEDAAKYFPARFDLPSTICQRRESVTMDPSKASHQTYCYVPGVGKVFEIELGNEIERLLAYEHDCDGAGPAAGASGTSP